MALRKTGSPIVKPKPVRFINARVISLTGFTRACALPLAHKPIQLYKFYGVHYAVPTALVRLGKTWATEMPCRWHSTLLAGLPI